MGLTSVRIEKDNEDKLNESCKSRGDKSKIINKALKEYFLPKQESSQPIRVKSRIKEVILT